MNIPNKKLKVLLVGQNYASVINSLSIGFDKLDSVSARAISLDAFTSQYNNYENYAYKTIPFNKGRFKYYFSKGIGIVFFIYLLLWCDLVHVYYKVSDTPFNQFEKWLVDLFCKRKVITFMGSEVRIPEVAATSNLYYENAFNNSSYEYQWENKETSYSIQLDYAQRNYQLIVWDIESYINRTIFPVYKIVPHASINTFKSIDGRRNDKLLIIHSPSAPVAKGSAMIEEVMAKITTAYSQVEYIVLTNISNKAYQDYLLNSDMMIDQLVWGGYGIAAQQAMEMGKVVFTYINKDRVTLYGNDCPIINVNKETLYRQVENLILDKEKLIKLKHQTQEYYLKTHEPLVVASFMKEAYISLFYGDKT